MAKFGIALGSGPRGLGFESRHSDQKPVTAFAVTGFLIGVMGFERPLSKHAGGMFLGRGRIPRFPGAVRWTVNGNRNVIENVKSLLLPK